MYIRTFSSSLYMWLLGGLSVLFWYSFSLHLCLCYSFVYNRRRRRRKRSRRTLKQDPARSVTALSMRWADQPGASIWLTALPLTSRGFDLTRREFHGGLCLRYGWEPSNLPSSCSCGQRFGLEHALTCRRGGYVAVRHDEVRDLFSACWNVLQHHHGIRAATSRWSKSSNPRCKPPRRCPAGHQSGWFLGEKSFWGHIFWCTIL